MRVLRGTMYKTKNIGPRTDSWGTPQEDVYPEDRLYRPKLTVLSAVTEGKPRATLCYRRVAYLTCLSVRPTQVGIVSK